MDLPSCCGNRMKIDIETGTYMEVICRKCGDRVYVKKADISKPQMLDD